MKNTTDSQPHERLLAAPYIGVDADQAPFIQGYRCADCGETLLLERQACPNCCSIGTLSACKLSTRGTVHTYTIVCRSFPGVSVPFVAVVVDLEGGGCLKGTLRLEQIAPENVWQGMPVSLEFEEISSTTDPSQHYLSYAFYPARKDDTDG